MITQVAASLLCAFLAAAAAHAQTGYTPPAGSAERKAIMDALRVPAEKDIGRKVIFRVEQLRVVGDWAFARVTPLQPGGKEIDYSRTSYAEQQADGAFDAEAETLLQRQAGRWKVREWRFGVTDTEVELWIEKYRLPKALFR